MFLYYSITVFFLVLNRLFSSVSFQFPCFICYVVLSYFLSACLGDYNELFKNFIWDNVKFNFNNTEKIIPIYLHFFPFFVLLLSYKLYLYIL